MCVKEGCILSNFFTSFGINTDCAKPKCSHIRVSVIFFLSRRSEDLVVVRCSWESGVISCV